ncbi:hypothetical protein EJO66_08105 [Variovorax beijingensis]|uniref:MgtE-like protein n=1 Tax=Variovorax beijingensis TaxID=2496117 RepID=A0ABY0AAP1_9BURK|nr:hypothetical protein [Variovorax beijingensis]RSZ40094.1 hypothetical protein EJO66_08105 [Variovorax beijingensis]
MIPRHGPSSNGEEGTGLPETGGARHAALLLHAMAPADRAWMLNALAPSEREGLLGLLAELEALGMERDPTLIAEATAGAPQPPSLPLSDEAVLLALEGSQVHELVECLRAEPPGLIARWLHLADWPWREELLAALEPAQRRRVDAALSAMSAEDSTPPAMRAALIEAVATQVRGPVAARGPAGKPWRKLKHSFDRLLRGRGARWRAGA